MLPTPDTSHVSYERIYEPAEDSFLLLDTLSSPSETAFLTARFNNSPASSHIPTPTSTSASTTAPSSISTRRPEPSPPLVLEIGPGSGVVLAFLTAHALPIFGTTSILSAGIDANQFACAATRETTAKAVLSTPSTSGLFLDAVQGDLATALRPGSVDVLVFNPPYVPTEDLPDVKGAHGLGQDHGGRKTTFEEDGRLLELSWAGGRDGMETTDRLLDSLPGVLSARGCAYVLLCAQNRPKEVKSRIRGFGDRWKAETVGSSGKQAGWEKLQIVRIWREEGEGR